MARFRSIGSVCPRIICLPIRDPIGQNDDRAMIHARDVAMLVPNAVCWSMTARLRRSPSTCLVVPDGISKINLRSKLSPRNYEPKEESGSNDPPNLQIENAAKSSNKYHLLF